MVADIKCTSGTIAVKKSQSIKMTERKKQESLMELQKGHRCRTRKNPVKLYVKKSFYNLGLIVGQFPLLFIIVPLVITAALSGGIFTMKLNYSINQMLTPSSAYSNYEAKVFLDYFRDEGGLFFFGLGVTAKDGGSLLRDEYRKDVLSLYKYFLHNYTVSVGNQTLSFDDLKVNHADENLLTTSILQTYSQNSTSFRFTYPVFTFNGENYFVGDNMRKVKLDLTTSLVQEMKLVWLFYNSAQVNEQHGVLLRAWALSFLEKPKITTFQRLNYYFWNDDLLAVDMYRNCWVVVPYVVLAFVVVIIFATVVSSTKNPVTSKPWEAVASIISVLLASGSGFGFVFYLGHPFVGTASVVPILVLALGMDVTYITLRNWRTTNPQSPPHIRLAETLEESGPSVVITVLTNVLSAGIGCITNIRLVYIFCLTLSISLTILFLLQITFFPAFIAYSGRREAANKHGWLICYTVKSNETKSLNNLPDVAATNYTYYDWWSRCAKYMAKFICTTFCRIIIIIIMIVYWATAIYCCSRMKLGLTVESLLLPDSPLLDTIKLETDVMNSGRIIFVTVSNPPNFSHPSDTKLFKQMVSDFESFYPCIGMNATSLWYRSYESFASYLDDNVHDDFYNILDMFLLTSTGNRWKNYINTEKINGTLKIKNFFFTVAYQRSYDWPIRNNYTFQWRQICSRYPKFNVTTWCEDNYNYITDQLVALPGNTIQDIAITGVCMAVVCILFIPNVFNTLCAIITVFSINVGTFGYLLAWDVALDPVSMTSLLISIGYSVDFTSHISYHYYSSHGQSQQEKLTSALSSIGLPMLESGLSTLLCVACMCFVPSYIELVFFKNIFLVISIGLVHGLIILPTFLAWIPINCLNKLYMKKQKVHQTTNNVPPEVSQQTVTGN